MKCLSCNQDTEQIGKEMFAPTSRGDFSHPFILTICKSCGLIQKNITKGYKDLMVKVYSSDYKLPAGGRNFTYVEGKPLSREKLLINNLLKTLEIKSSGKMLDLGTGQGHLVETAAEILSDWEIYGYDVSDKNKHEVLDRGAQDFFTGNLESIDISFDLIILNHVLEHVFEPRELLRKITNILAPEGYVVIVVPSYEKAQSDFYFLEHVAHYSKTTLNQLLSQNGFYCITTLEGQLGPIEIAFVGQKTRVVKPDEIELMTARIQKMKIRIAEESRLSGVFGVKGMGMYLASNPTTIDYLLDDSPEMVGEHFNGKPIYSRELAPNDSVLFVAYNNPHASRKMSLQLKESLPNLQVVDLFND